MKDAFVTVANQAELDIALNRDKYTDIELGGGFTSAVVEHLPEWACLYVRQGTSAHVPSGKGTVSVSGGARVKVGGNVQVYAYGDARVTAVGGASVRAEDRVEVSAFNRVTVQASANSQVFAHDETTVYAKNEAHVETLGWGRVEAADNVTVNARGIGRVFARGRSIINGRGDTVQAAENATVHAYAGKVTAGPGCVVFRHSPRVSIDALNEIDVCRGTNTTDPAAWCEYHGVEVNDGKAILFKALDSNLTSGHCVSKFTRWTIGSEMVCPDWVDDNSCGYGYHFSPRPTIAESYTSLPRVARFLAVEVDLADLRPIPESETRAKCKARRCRPLYEVDRMGQRIDG